MSGRPPESVWDYPRPPRVEDDERPVEIWAGGITIARSPRSRRVLETASPPVHYLPPEAVTPGVLVPSRRVTRCEWKGRASYRDVQAAGLVVPDAAWLYEAPSPGFEGIAGWVAFYPARVECYLDGERVRPQAGGFYGGWVTDAIRGPFKGEPGTEGW